MADQLGVKNIHTTLIKKLGIPKTNVREWIFKYAGKMGKTAGKISNDIILKE